MSSLFIRRNKVHKHMLRTAVCLLLSLFFIQGYAQSICNASFDYTVTCGNEFQFKIQSLGSDLTYAWDFGDRMHSEGKDPRHVYKEDKSYQVILHVSNKDNSCKDSSYKLVFAENNVQAYARHGVSPGNHREYTFENYNCTGTNLTYSWNFGDGQTSNGPTVTHLYSNDDAHVATLTVTDSINGCSDICTDTLFSPCDADFTYSSQFLNYFSFQSKAPYYTSKVLWDFGDGTTLTSKSPFFDEFHEYKSYGTFNVCQTISSVNCNTVTVCKQVENKQKPCKANFETFIYHNYLIPNTLGFTDLSTGRTSHTKTTWDFGDGSPNDHSWINSEHTYDHIGIYNVCLTITDSTTNCASSYCSKIVIAKLNCRPPFSAVPEVTNRKIVNLSLKPVSGRTYVWDFGDGTTSTDPFLKKHTYAAPGDYTICLTSTDPESNCMGTSCITISISSCTADFTYTVDEANKTYRFNAIPSANSYTYKWIFTDGTESSFPSPVHAFAYDGWHRVKLYVSSKSDSSCHDSIVKTVKVDIYKNCTASFHVDHDPASNNPNAFIITNFVLDSYFKYYWSYGDGEQGKQQSHTYSGNGPYTICLYGFTENADTICRPYHCETISGDGTDSLKISFRMVTGIDEPAADQVLLDNDPNPFHGSTIIHYTIKKLSQIEIGVYDLLGHKIAVLEQVTKPADSYTLIWNAEHVKEGLYLLQLKTADQLITKKIIISN